jgi:hypothetical protein
MLIHCMVGSGTAPEPAAQRIFQEGRTMSVEAALALVLG